MKKDEKEKEEIFNKEEKKEVEIEDSEKLDVSRRGSKENLIENE